jgi:hypothetical protein
VTTARNGRRSERLDLEDYVEQHPMGMVVAAFGVGYVLSGALFSRATARLLGLGLTAGLRFATPSLMKAVVGGRAAVTPGNSRPHAR